MMSGTFTQDFYEVGAPFYLLFTFPLPGGDNSMAHNGKSLGTYLLYLWIRWDPSEKGKVFVLSLQDLFVMAANIIYLIIIEIYIGFMLPDCTNILY